MGTGLKGAGITSTIAHMYNLLHVTQKSPKTKQNKTKTLDSQTNFTTQNDEKSLVTQQSSTMTQWRFQD